MCGYSCVYPQGMLPGKALLSLEVGERLCLFLEVGRLFWGWTKDRGDEVGLPVGKRPQESAQLRWETPCQPKGLRLFVSMYSLCSTELGFAVSV